MLRFFKSQNGFAIFVQIFFSVWIIGLIVTFTFDKFVVHEFLNSCHSKFFDHFFQLITFLGDGVFAVILSVVVFFSKGKKEGVLLLGTFLISALLAQFFKNFIFTDAMRPFFYIRAGELKVETIEGIKMHVNHSFPSGHTTTIFALCSMFSLFFNSKKIGINLISIAIITAYSRVYLSQHFLQDILAGALLGVISSSIIYYFSEKKISVVTNNSIEK